jgi:hypothetical protein
MVYLLGQVHIVVQKMILNVIIMFIVKLIIQVFSVCNKWFVQFKRINVHHLHKMFLLFLTYRNRVIFLQKQNHQDNK